MKKIMLFAMLLAMMVLTTSMAQAVPVNFRAHLSEELSTVETLGQGQAIFQISKDGLSVSYRLIVANIDNISMAHIHVAAAPGANGPPAVWLYPSAQPPVLIPGYTQGTLATGLFTSANFVGPLAGMTMSALVTAIEEGRAYVNVHTTAYPGGEIRGTLRFG